MNPDLTLSPSVRFKLSAMMFLQFFVWGAYFVTMGTYLVQGLRFTGTEAALAYSTLPWGAIVAPFVIGMIADRFFAAEKLLGVLHLVGAGLLLLGFDRHHADRLLLGCWLLYAALLQTRRSRLVNAVAFNQIGKPREAVSVGAPLRHDRLDRGRAHRQLELKVGADGDSAVDPRRRPAALLRRVRAFALPHTPPKSLGRKVTVRDVLGLDALSGS